MAIIDDLLNITPAERQSERPSKEEYATKKKAEREDIFALSVQKALEVSRDCDKFQQYLDMQAVLDRYSAANTLLVMAQKPEATRLGSFDYWKSKGCSVRPGQTAISILEPHEYAKEDGTSGTGYNIKKVFDISQVDASNLKTEPASFYTERQLLQSLILKAPIDIRGVDELPGNLGAMTDPKSGDLLVRKGMRFSDTFRNVAHGLALFDLTKGPNSQIDSHFSAYCTAYLLCKKYNVDIQMFNFKDAPIRFADIDAQSFKNELTQIRDTAANICGRMKLQLEQTKDVISQESR